MDSWVRNLKGRSAHGAELDWAGVDGDRVRSELGEGALSWAIETGEKLAVAVTDAVPAQGEGGHFNALRRATTSAALRALLLIAGSPNTMDLIGPETVEVARDFARRGVSLEDLLKGVRHGYSILAATLLDAADSSTEVDRSTEVKRVSLLLFAQIDSIMDVASSEYQQEKADYQATVTAARLDAVHQILSGTESVDIPAAAQALGYPLDAPRHLALVAWMSKPDYGIALRSTVDRVFREIGIGGPTLTLPVGSQVMWSWRALDEDPGLLAAPSGASADGSRIALGQVGSGLAGFRRSHRQARAVEALVSRRASDARVTSHADVELPALLASDMTAARDLVERRLGPLAEDSPRMLELRRTLLCYLDFERSVSKVASELHINRNTVTYRVQQGMRLCGYEPGMSPLPLHAALSVVDWLD